MARCEFTWHDRECGMRATRRVRFEPDEVLNLCEDDFHEMTDDAPDGTWSLEPAPLEPTT